MQKLIRRGAAALLAGLFVGLAAPGLAFAQADAWPSRPIKLVVPFPPGGGTDVLARMIAERLRPMLGQAVVIENRPGATGNIGNDVVAKSPPDGHTVLIQGTIIGMFPHIFSKLSYDPLKDLLAVGTIAESANVIVVSPSSPFNTLQGEPLEPVQHPAGPAQGRQGRSVQAVELRDGRSRFAPAPGH